MKILFEKAPRTIDEKIAASYTEINSNIIKEFVKLSSENNFLNLSFTPKPKKDEKSFFTYEIKKGNFNENYSIIVWRGIRTGDGVPILYAEFENEK